MKELARGDFQSVLWQDGDRLYFACLAFQSEGIQTYHFDILLPTAPDEQYVYMPNTIKRLAREAGLQAEDWNMKASYIMQVNSFDNLLDDPLPYFMRAML